MFKDIISPLWSLTFRLIYYGNTKDSVENWVYLFNSIKENW
jgi:hypothetical protein